MKNPILAARERKGLSQQTLSRILGVSQQFIQRHEVGAAAQLPQTIGAYYNQQFPHRERMNFLADIIDESENKDRIPARFFPSDSGFSSEVTSFGSLYGLYVLLDRASLPDLFTLTKTAKTRGDLRDALCIALSADTNYELACRLHVNPYVLAGIFLQTNFNLTMPLVINALPGPLLLALNGTGTNVTA